MASSRKRAALGELDVVLAGGGGQRPTRARKPAAPAGVIVTGPPRRPGTKAPLSVTVSRTPKGTEIATIGIFDLESFREGRERVADLLAGRRARAGSERGRLARRAQSANDTADVDAGILRAVDEHRRAHPDHSDRTIAKIVAPALLLNWNTLRNRMIALKKKTARNPRS